MRNPDWTREEMILALDVYLRSEPRKIVTTDPSIVALSEILRNLPFHPQVARGSTFRNPTGVAMTLRTFMRYDSRISLRGLRPGHLALEIWREFAKQPAMLRSTAESILLAARTIATIGSSDAKWEASEGGILIRLHKLRERDRSLVARKRAQVLRETGELKCEACGFSFLDTYGSIGEGYIECHHRRPLHELVARAVTKLKDLAVVCANCHRMLHRSRPAVTVEKLRSKVFSTGNR